MDHDNEESAHIAEAISLATQGSKVDALYLLRECAEGLYTGAKLNPLLALYLANCLSKIVKDEGNDDPAKALNLVPQKRGSGRPPTAESKPFEDAVAIQAAILLAERTKGIKKTATLEILGNSSRNTWRSLEGRDFSAMASFDDQTLIAIAGDHWQYLLSKIS
ncbi:hypothetical protein [Ralstonia wenshanensis]|uniref:Uncharacterized protein n=1 Tax=Ralstonia wenshanensis TaxID=2842456 RepID=A0AAD2B460_9RALS|nr:hypothetical protein [Ralstonia wenshanensis]CAJ0699234.1 hypothetical protein LMG18091_02883 [Ralstonia wenshanensis]